MTDAEINMLIETALATPEDQPGRHDQIRSKLEDGDREEVAKFCAYHLQFDALGLKPHELAPCWGDGSTNAPHDRLIRRLMKAGISKYHPDPLCALKDAA